MKGLVMKKLCLTLLIGFLFFSVSGYSKDFNVMDYGAVPDGKTDNTKAFQTALDDAGKVGGIVRVPAGKFRFDGNLIIPRGTSLEGTWLGLHHPEVDCG